MFSDTVLAVVLNRLVMNIIVLSVVFSALIATVTSKCEYIESDVCDVNKHSPLIKEVSKVEKQMKDGTLNEKSCDVCRKVICLMKKCIDSTAKWAYLTKWYCLSTYGNPECEQSGILYGPHLYFVMNNTKLTVDEMCGVLLFKGCAKDSKILNWKIKLPPPNKRYIDFKTKPKRILHISDIHYDPYYAPGSVVNCVGLVCCRRESKSRNSNEPDGSAGYWGELWSTDRKKGLCGAPLSIIEKTFDYINRTQKIDLILWTGDNTRHLMDSSKEIILQTSKTITELFNKYFKKSVIVVSLGNHEGLPNSQYATVNYKEIETFKLYEGFVDLWRNWMNGDRSVNTFLNGGYYSSTVNNVKIISLNTNLCSRRNFWTLYDPIDPQLKWLTDELLQSEKAKQMAMIIGHFPPTFSNCIDLWTENYLKILERFRSVIIGNYFAHLHSDQFNVYYSTDGQPISYGLIASSLVTYNPSYRLYSLDENGVISDAETYFVDLTKLNEMGETAKVNYRKLYSMRNDYEINAVTPYELDKLYQRIVSNNTLLQLYFKNNGLRSVKEGKVCDERCKERIVYKSIPVKSSDFNTNDAFKIKSFTLNTIACFIAITFILN